MAKFELNFIDALHEEDIIKVEKINRKDIGSDYILISISLGSEDYDCPCEILLDKSTAIKFAKTLRTEINKITEREVNNG